MAIVIKKIRLKRCLRKKGVSAKKKDDLTLDDENEQDPTRVQF